MTVNPQEVVSKYKALLQQNNTLQQSQWGSISINGNELQNATTLTNKTTNITKRRRKKEQLSIITTQVIFLFKKDNALYIGGDRDQPELIYEAEEDETIGLSRITKTNESIDGYKIMFISTKEDSRTYLNTYVDGSIFTVDYDNSPIEQLSFLLWDGSFIGIGTKNMFSDEDREVVANRIAAAFSAYALAVESRRLAILADLGSEEFPNQYFDPVTERYYVIGLDASSVEEEIPTTVDIKSFFGYLPETQGKSYKTTSSPTGFIVIQSLPGFDPPEEALYEFYGIENVVCIPLGLGGRQCIIVLRRSTNIVLSPSRFVPIANPNISLFARPEDNVIRDIEVDNYPAEERVFDVYYTEEEKISSSEFDSIKGFDSTSAIFVKDDSVFIKGSLDRDLNISTDISVNNFITETIYEVQNLDDVEIQEQGTIDIKTININNLEDPTISDSIPIEYTGITTDFQNSIVNYSIFV